MCNTPGASTRSVVELTIGHLIASTRHIATADRTLRNGEWAKKQLRGSEIGGKRLGLIGFGRIARGVAAIASSFGMEVHAFDPSSMRHQRVFNYMTMWMRFSDIVPTYLYIAI